MVKKKRPKKNEQRNDSKPLIVKKDSLPLYTFINGPHAKWLFFGIFFLVTIFLFRDFLVHGDTMLFGSDTIPDGIYTRQYYKDYHDEFGGIPRWNPFILGGLPFIDGMHGDTFYPAAWLKFYMPLTRALGHKLIWHVFIAGVFMYIFLRTLNVRRDAAFLGGLMYMLAPSFVSWLYGGHDAKMYVISIMPLAFAFLETGMKRPKFYKFACLGAVMGLLILTSHIQMAYYSYWAIGLYFIFRLFFDSDTSKSARARRAVLFITAVIIALAIGSVQLFPAYKFTTSQSVRAGEERTGYDYATSWSMHFEEAAGMIVPSFPGFDFIDGRAGNQRTYWGKNPFKLNTEYHGIAPILFGVLALLLCRDRRRWFLLGIALLSFIYALGATTPLYRLFYLFVPGVKNFRAPGMIIFLFCFACVVLSSQFISLLLDDKISLRYGKNTFLYAVGVIVASAVVVSLMGRSFFGLWQSIFYRSIPEMKVSAMAANLPYFTRDLWRVVLLASVSLMGVWMFLSRKIGGLALVFLVSLVVIIDDSFIDRKFITIIDPIRYRETAPDLTVEELQAKRAESSMPFRVLALDIIPGNRKANYYAMFGIQVADGFHNNELKTYELFKGGRRISNFTYRWIEDNKFVSEGLAQNNFLKVAGVKYLVLPTGKGSSQLLENTGALERAFIVHDCVVVENDTVAVEMLKDISFDPARKVIITGDIEHTGTVSDSGSIIESFSYEKNGIMITADLQSPGFLVLSENMVPYWDAMVDGKPVDIHKAFGTFMSVKCPEGRHEIRFVFRSPPYEKGKKLASISLVFVILSLAFSGITAYKVRRKKTA